MPCNASQARSGPLRPARPGSCISGPLRPAGSGGPGLLPDLNTQCAAVSARRPVLPARLPLQLNAPEVPGQRYDTHATALKGYGAGRATRVRLSAPLMHVAQPKQQVSTRRVCNRRAGGPGAGPASLPGNSKAPLLLRLLLLLLRPLLLLSAGPRARGMGMGVGRRARAR